MERTPAKRSSLFLLELMIAILFFCLASAVCVQIFVKAHTISRETQELNTALEKVSGYTELFLADALTEDTEVFYDASWQECSKDEASYEIVIRWSRMESFCMEHLRCSACPENSRKKSIRWKQTG